VSQQPLRYEVGRIRMLVWLLPQIAQTFGITADDLLGRKMTAAGKRGPASKLQ
jgi:hypothetical protein